jgi:hypothetical protein
MKSKITLSEQIHNPRENRRHNQNRYPNTQILDHSLAGLGTCASIQSGAVIVLFAKEIHKTLEKTYSIFQITMAATLFLHSRHIFYRWNAI